MGVHGTPRRVGEIAKGVLCLFFSKGTQTPKCSAISLCEGRVLLALKLIVEDGSAQGSVIVGGFGLLRPVEEGFVGEQRLEGSRMDRVQRLHDRLQERGQVLFLYKGRGAQDATRSNQRGQRRAVIPVRDKELCVGKAVQERRQKRSQ